MDEATETRLVAQLEEEAAALAHADTQTAESRAPVELDQASVGRLSRMDALQQQAMAQAQSRRRKNALARIRAALERARRGEYGDCIGCGEEIEARRLELDPAAPLCLACASGRRD